jgi:hypothetical protein
MTSRSSDAKQEGFSYAWSSMSGPETKASEKGFAYSWSSVPGAEPKTKEKAFSYSWSSPAPNPSQTTPTMPEGPNELQGGPDQAGVTEALPLESILGVIQGVSGRIFGGGLPSIRKVGVIGWSAVAGSGAILAMVDAGPSVATQLGSIGGLWLGISAAIWFLPKIVR